MKRFFVTLALAFSAPAAAAPPPLPDARIQKPSAFVIISRAIPAAVPKAPEDRARRKAELERAYADAPTSVSADDLLVLGALRSITASDDLEAALAAWNAIADRGEDAGPLPVADFRSARDALEAVLARTPKTWPGALEAYDHLAWLYAEDGPAHDPQHARAASEAVTTLAPSGPIVARAHFRLAELAFDAGDMRRAKPAYDAAARAEPGGSLAAFAAYKAAWSRFTLGEVADAITQMEAVARTGTVIDREAERDVTRMWASIPAKATEAVSRILALSPERGPSLVVELADELMLADQRKACLAALDALGAVPEALRASVERLRLEASRP